MNNDPQTPRSRLRESCITPLPSKESRRGEGKAPRPSRSRRARSRKFLRRARKKALAAHRALLQEWHQRQHRIAGLLAAAIARLSEKDPHVLEKRAYLTLAGAVYEQLMAGKSGLRNEDLVALSKALAEHRRVSLREPVPDGTACAEKTQDREESWEKLADGVREVYGVNWQPPSAEQPPNEFSGVSGQA